MPTLMNICCRGVYESNGQMGLSLVLTLGLRFFKDFTHVLDEWAVSDPGQLEYFGGELLVTQSHGQSMMSYFRARYKIRGIYLLDEPETALSPKSQLELLDIINKNSLTGQAQFIIATHSPLLLACSWRKNLQL